MKKEFPQIGKLDWQNLSTVVYIYIFFNIYFMRVLPLVCFFNLCFAGFEGTVISKSPESPTLNYFAPPLDQNVH